MNKEIHYEGWLIKSPPTKRIWRARWRRRWFTLKQGEIPEQFCLEYYTDRNCRKLKGVIDLDQCEQVDCGLRLENRKQNFQFMFVIKTPKRTYYLAADTEADMRDWVNCICQVCHLHDTKQSNELQDENRTQNTASTALTNSTNNTTTTSLNSSGPLSAATIPSSTVNTLSNSGNSNTLARQSINSDILRRPHSAVIDQQPLGSGAAVTYQNNTDYVNTEYTNRETLVSSMRLVNPPQQLPSSPGAVYLNSPIFGAQAQREAAAATRLAVNSNGVVRKIPENLVLNNTPLTENQSIGSVQPSPALSTASGPYIPISECFSGSPKFLVDGNCPTTPLNNLDPKFYDTPRSHNNIGLNLTNDQSYSPKITNFSVQQMTPAAASKSCSSHRSDSDSDSVFAADDDEWTHPRPLKENIDRNTRPSESSIENESFVLTYSKRFSKFPEDGGKMEADKKNSSSPKNSATSTTERMNKKLMDLDKNKKKLMLNFKEGEKTPRDLPQFSDTENTSPAIGPRDANSVVDESYDIPRSHNLPYYNMAQLLDKNIISPESNPIAASTPNLMATLESPGPSTAASSCSVARSHCYTNAAPSKVEGNVFRYDFDEQGDLPPVNRQLKPHNMACLEEKSQDLPNKPIAQNVNVASKLLQQQQHCMVESLSTKLITTNLQSPSEPAPLKPPSVDRKLKPSAYKMGNSSTMAPSVRRTTGAPLSMYSVSYSNEGSPFDGVGAGGIGEYSLETRTLPRQLNNRSVYGNTAGHSGATIIQHQRTASAAAALQLSPPTSPSQLPQTNEHTLQYFDLDVANPPPINRQSTSVGNLPKPSKAPVKSSVVYNFVDFVKTDAFKRIREERKKESEGSVSSSNK